MSPSNSDFSGRKPDYTVSALDKETGRKGRVGSAWIQPDQSIRIKLNPFTVLDTTLTDLVITLSEVDGKPNRKTDQDEDFKAY